MELLIDTILVIRCPRRVKINILRRSKCDDILYRYALHPVKDFNLDTLRPKRKNENGFRMQVLRW